jgi:MFS family permease
MSSPSSAKLTMTFAVANGLGRFLFGLISDKTHGSVSWLPKAAYFLVSHLLYIIVFLVCSISYVYKSDPFVVCFLLGGGIAYGGMFTMITAYMKSICHPDRVGVLLGLALVCVAMGSYGFSKLANKKLTNGEDIHGHVYGAETKKYFFVVALVCQIPGLAISYFLYRSQRAELAAKALEAEKSSDSDSSETDDEPPSNK